MSTTKRLLLGALAFLPALYLLLFAAFILAIFIPMHTELSADYMAERFWPLFTLHGAMLMLTAVMVAIYLMLVMRNRDLSDTMRIVWATLIALVGVLAAPVYWWRYVWRARPSQRA